MVRCADELKSAAAADQSLSSLQLSTRRLLRASDYLVSGVRGGEAGVEPSPSSRQKQVRIAAVVRVRALIEGRERGMSWKITISYSVEFGRSCSLRLQPLDTHTLALRHCGRRCLGSSARALLCSLLQSSEVLIPSSDNNSAQQVSTTRRYCEAVMTNCNRFFHQRPRRSDSGSEHKCEELLLEHALR